MNETQLETYLDTLKFCQLKLSSHPEVNVRIEELKWILARIYQQRPDRTADEC